MMPFSILRRSVAGILRKDPASQLPLNMTRAAFSSVIEQTNTAPPAPESNTDPIEAAGVISSSKMPGIKVYKRDITQSPKKVRFLLKLVRNAWVPDALAQMKFSPKHKSVDVAALIKRAVAVLQSTHELIPEQLMVTEVLVTKGKQQKQLTIQGRGRTGYGYRRYSHIWLRVEQINFAKQIEKAETQTQKQKWAQMAELVERLRETPESYDLKPVIRERQLWKNKDAYDKPKPPRSR